MPNLSSPNKIMGKVKQSPFTGSKVPSSTPLKKSNTPALIAIVLLGAALILFLMSRQTQTRTGPLTVLTQSAAPDQSTIDNLTASILALQGLVYIPSQEPAGGASTPIIPPPNTGGGSSTITPAPNTGSE